MNIFWAFWSLVCCVITTNGARNRYSYYSWRDSWFLFYVALAVWNGCSAYYFLVN